MTRKKRKDSKQSGNGVDSNSQNTSANEVNNSENIEVSIETRKLRGKGNSTVSSPKSTAKGVREVLNSGLVDNSDRVGTRRSMRRPSSSTVDSAASSPPVKRLKRVVESEVEGATPTVSISDNDTVKNDKVESKRNSKSSQKKDSLGSTESDHAVIQENHGNRKNEKYERTRKRRLVDVNEDSNIPATENLGLKDSPLKKDESKILTKLDSKTMDSKRTNESTKKRRKVNNTNTNNDAINESSPLSHSVDENPVKVPQRCAQSDNEHEDKLETRLNDDDSDADWENWIEQLSDVKGDPLVNRIWKSSSSAKTVDDDSCFSISSYNILAESLLKTSHYFGNITSAHWNQKNRHKLLMRELKDINADIFALQEVEKSYQSELLSRDLSSLGYSEFYACSESSGRTEGVAIYYRNSRFTETARNIIPLAKISDSLIDELNMLDEQKDVIREYAQEPQMMQCIILKCLKTSKEICLCNTHISYAKHKKPDLRCVQVARSVEHIMSFLSSNGHQSPHLVPVVFSGDFNSKPTSAVYQLCRDGYLNDSKLNSLQQCQNINIHGINKERALVDVLWKAFQHSADDLQSCYYEILDREPPLTINLEGNTGCVDYLWYTKKSLSVEAVLIPRSIVLRQLKDNVPNADFPSDHLSLCARLSFK